jgi:hypothetical protein
MRLILRYDAAKRFAAAGSKPRPESRSPMGSHGLSSAILRWQGRVLRHNVLARASAPIRTHFRVANQLSGIQP